MVLDLLPYHFNLQRVGAVAPFLTSDLEASLISFLEMAEMTTATKHPWSEGPSQGGQLPPPHEIKTVASHGWACCLM
jgi:hypothetical protein